MQGNETIIVSRTDSIGDVVLTLPLCGVLKERFPACKIIFLGNLYTRPVLKNCIHVDKSLDWQDIKKLSEKEQLKIINELNANIVIHVFPNKEIAQLFKKSNIALRVATNRRIYHLFSCNVLVNLTRKNTNFHEAQLNIQLLKGLKIELDAELNQIPKWYGLSTPQLNDKVKSFINPNKKNILLHPKSKGSAREWGAKNFAELIKLLPEKEYSIIVCGTEAEAKLFRQDLIEPFKEKVIDAGGKLSLEEYMTLIANSYALVAASTGPLHIAAALGIKAIGLYAPMRPIFPTRWAPLGNDAHYLVKDKKCDTCAKSTHCQCIEEITPHEVINCILK